MLSRTIVNMKRSRFYIDFNVIHLKFVPYPVLGACAAVACLSHKVFGKYATTWIDTNVFVISVRDIDHLLIMTKWSEEHRRLILKTDLCYQNAVACFSHKEFGKCATLWINTFFFLISIREIRHLLMETKWSEEHRRLILKTDV